YADYTYNCQNQGLERRVEVHYLEEKGYPPCEVRYYKDSEVPGEMLGSEMISVRGENLAHLLNWAITQGL
ncbi:hypothetical protein QQ73_07710, partial [Candidatus Endoriftia persephone str. Guaymas]|nr:hypothetical protein [Candidatus Endoriftia persephone str. Guaymas]